MVGIFDDPAALHSTVIAQASPILVVAPAASAQPPPMEEAAPRPVAQATPGSQPRPRSEISAPICRNPSVSDTALYEDPRDPTKVYYLPRYRTGQETVNGQQRFGVSLHQVASSQNWQLEVSLEAYPAPEIQEGARSADVLPHDVRVMLRYIPRGENSPTELTFGEVRLAPHGYVATLTISDLNTQLAVYLELTTSDRVTSLVVVRTMTAAATQGTGIGQSGSDEKLYTEQSWRLELTAEPRPFIFPTSVFGYVTEGVQPPITEGSRLRLCRASWQDRDLYFPYYQNMEQGLRHEFFYLPDTFKLSREQSAPHTPAMTLKYELSDDGLTVASATLEYRLAPYTDPRRLAAAAIDLRSYLSASDQKPIQLKPLMSAAALQLSIRLPGQRELAARSGATVDLQYGIDDELRLTGEQVQQLFAALSSPSGKNQLFNGVVTVLPTGFPAEQRQQILFAVRVDDTAGPTCDFTAVPQASGSLKGCLTNQIESPVQISQVTATVFRLDRSGPAEVREFDPPLPVTLSPSDEATFVIVPPATLPPKGALRARVDLPNMRVRPDRDAIYEAIVDGQSPEMYTRTIRVWTPESTFTVQPALAAIKVDFQHGGSVQLSSDRLAGSITVRMPVKSFVLRLPDDGSYNYRITLIPMKGSKTTGTWTPDSTDNLVITVP